MLGGGTFTTVGGKTLPGTYINFVQAASVSGAVGERGVVAIIFDLGTDVGYSKVIEITKQEFYEDATTKMGVAASDDTMKPFREIFKHANKCVIYNMDSDDPTLAAAFSALEAYEFNVLAAYTATPTEYITQITTWRDTVGKKCQIVTYGTTQTYNNEGVINVINTVSDTGADTFALVAWVAGAEAGCEVNKSCTNMKYDGEYTVIPTATKTNLEAAITAGNIAFHLVYGDIRMLEDINTFTSDSNNVKGDDFKYNQTIRVIDQIANDIAKIFNTRFLGRIQNNASGRISFWSEIVKHHKTLETMEAIEGFNSESIVVSPVDGHRNQIQVQDAITPVNAMSQVYMTVVVS